MAKLKLPFELEKPSSNEYVTQASEIGYKGRSLEEGIYKVLKDRRCESETINIGDYIYDTDNSRLGRKIGEGATDYTYRALASIPDGEGYYIYQNSIGEFFLLEVINHALVCIKTPSTRRLAGYGNPARNTVRAYDLLWDKTNHIVRNVSFFAAKDPSNNELFVDEGKLYQSNGTDGDPIIVNESSFASGEKAKNVSIGDSLPTPTDNSLVKGGTIYPLIDKVLKDKRCESETINIGDYVYDTDNSRISQKTGESTYSHRLLSSIPDGEGRYVYRNSINEFFLLEVINHALVCVEMPSIRNLAGYGYQARENVRAYDLLWDKTNHIVRDYRFTAYPNTDAGKLFVDNGILYCSASGQTDPHDVVGLSHDLKKFHASYPLVKCPRKLYNNFFLSFKELTIKNAPKNVQIGVGRLIQNNDYYQVEFKWDGMSDFDPVTGLYIRIPMSDTGLQMYNIRVATGLPYSGYAIVDTDLIDKTASVGSNNLFNDVKFDNRIAVPDYGEIILPPKLYALKNRRWRICMESILNTHYPALIKGTDYVAIRDGASSSYSPPPGFRTDVFGHIYTSIVSDRRLVLTYVNNGVVADRKLVLLDVIDKSEHTGTMKVMVIGDSRTERNTKLEYINTQNANDSLHIEFVGKNGADDTKHEGYSARNIIDFCTSPTLNNKTNYFYDSSIEGTYKFSLTHYVQETGIEPDVIVIDHGANQASKDFETEVRPCYEFIIADVANYNTNNNKNIKIMIAVQDGGGLLDKPDGITNSKYSFGRHGKQMVETFKNRESSGVYLLPEYINVDEYNDYPFGVATEPNNSSVHLRMCFDGAHPGDQSFLTAYNNSTAYNVGGRVRYNNEAYGCWVPTVAGEKPDEHPEKWLKIDASIGAGYRNIGEIYYVYLHYIAREIYGE